MNWRISDRADKEALPLADRHYNRQKVGSPQFVPPGRCLVLMCVTGAALWVTSWPFAQYVKHAWAGAWVNSMFRRESGPIASELIREAVAITRWYWPDAPSVRCPECNEWVSLVSFIDQRKVRKKRDFGRCYVKAGFKACGYTKGGLKVVHLSTNAMPEPQEPFCRQLELLGRTAGTREG